METIEGAFSYDKGLGQQHQRGFTNEVHVLAKRGMGRGGCGSKECMHVSVAMGLRLYREKRRL